MKLTEKDALIIVDVQNDFLPGGALAVPKGDEIIPVINAIQDKFDFIVVTQDFHPADHKSFAANNPGRQIGELIDLNGLSQVLWPVHCVQGTEGAEFSKDLIKKTWRKVFQKGMNREVDSYSGFFDNAKRGDTGLSTYLKKNQIDRVFICGLALDYCVKFTALDANELEFDTFLFTDATRAVNLNPEDGKDALAELEAAGVKLITSDDL
ncbi:bifunctional nicotinamidase/pyrazinamidase [Algoriphagus marinus]|uniref:bifunctional nicotinamidase/pyrazinamidase n=1 Tax=Algoriphagus marinus TaxID=1925762 RepID=UPI00094BA895|nr:bifunctional nicotinamidase/pyrazinamidase [Algoriphagus marinus]